MRRDHALSSRRGCAIIKLVGAGSLFLAMPSMLEIRAAVSSRRVLPGRHARGHKVARKFDWFDDYWAIDDSLVAAADRSRRCGSLWRMARRTDHLIDLEVHSRFTTLLTRAVDGAQPDRFRR